MTLELEVENSLQHLAIPLEQRREAMQELAENYKVLFICQVWQNGYAERLMRTIKEEEVDLSECEDYTDAVRQLGRFFDEGSMHKRIHSSLGYLTPLEFEQQWLSQQASKPAMK